MRLGLLTAAAVLAVSLAAVGALDDAPDPTRSESVAPHSSRKPKPTPTPRPPRLTRVELNQQDRVNTAHAARESRALDARPLLSELPLQLGPVTLDAAGLVPDGRRTLISLAGPDRATAERAYRQSLAALGDHPSHYETRWIP